MNNECKHISKKQKIEVQTIIRPELELVVQRYKNYNKFPHDEHIALCEQYNVYPYNVFSLIMTNLIWLENDMSSPIKHTNGLRGVKLNNLNYILKKQEEIRAKYPWIFMDYEDKPLPTDTINYEKYIRECLNTLTDDELKMLVPK
jgi:hypothetical protein